MHLPRPSAATAVILAGIVIINLVALNWTTKFFRHQFGHGLLRYGDRMPTLEGRGYSEGQFFTVDKNRPNFVLYISPQTVKGRSVSLLKFCEVLRRRSPESFWPVLITRGVLPEAQQLLQEKLIGFPVINDAGGDLANRLGLDTGESGTFFFNKNGTCELSSRQQADVDDLRQLLGIQDIAASDANRAGWTLSKGKSLPLWEIVNARSQQRVTTSELQTKADQLWVFLLADCFSCGAPSSERYLC